MADDSHRIRLVVFTLDAPTAIAQARGLFAAEGVTVQIERTTSSIEQMRAVGEGKVDMVSTAFDNVLAWSGKAGGEIVAVAQIENGVKLAVYVRPEIKTIAELKGKRLAADAPDTAYALVLRRILLEHGLDLQRGDYGMLGAGSSGKRLEAVLQGDAAGALMNGLASQTLAEGAGLKRLADHDELLPAYPGVVLAANRMWAERQRETLRRFLRAWRRALQWAHEPGNRNEAVRLVAADERTTMRGQNTADTARQALDNTSADGVLNLAGLQSVLDLRMRVALAPTLGGALERYCDAGYYQDVAGR